MYVRGVFTIMLYLVHENEIPWVLSGKKTGYPRPFHMGIPPQTAGNSFLIGEIGIVQYSFSIMYTLLSTFFTFVVSSLFKVAKHSF